MASTIQKESSAFNIVIATPDKVPRVCRGRIHANWSPFRSQISAMPINLSIKNAPDDVVARLRQRARRHRRSLQGELLSIVEAAARDEITASPSSILTEVRGLELSTPGDAATIIRADREHRALERAALARPTIR